MKKALMIFFLFAIPLVAKADLMDMTNPASPMSPLNPYNPASPYNHYCNPISPYYVGRSNKPTKETNKPTKETYPKRGMVIIVGDSKKIQKVIRYQQCTEYCGGNACMNLLK